MQLADWSISTGSMTSSTHTSLCGYLGDIEVGQRFRFGFGGIEAGGGNEEFLNTGERRFGNDALCLWEGMEGIKRNETMKGWNIVGINGWS